MQVVDGADLLAMLNGERPRSKPANALKLEAIHMEIAEVYELLKKPNRYTAGDWVSPRSNTPLHEELQGRAFLVVDTIENPGYFFIGNPKEYAFGSRPDIRVASYRSGTVYLAWHESWMFEPYSREEALAKAPR